MYTLFTILIILICVLLVLIVLIQKPKGGGLNPNFSGSSQLMGVKKTTDVVERSTWMLSLALLVFTLMINMWIDRGGEAQEATQLREKAESAAVGLPGPGAPAPAAPGGATPVEPGPGTPSPAAPGGATPAQSGQGAAPGQ